MENVSIVDFTNTFLKGWDKSFIEIKSLVVGEFRVPKPNPPKGSPRTLDEQSGARQTPPPLTPPEAIAQNSSQDPFKQCIVLSAMILKQNAVPFSVFSLQTSTVRVDLLAPQSTTNYSLLSPVAHARSGCRFRHRRMCWVLLESYI